MPDLICTSSLYYANTLSFYSISVSCGHDVASEDNYVTSGVFVHSVYGNTKLVFSNCENMIFRQICYFLEGF